MAAIKRNRPSRRQRDIARRNAARTSGPVTIGHARTLVAGLPASHASTQAGLRASRSAGPMGTSHNVRAASTRLGGPNWRTRGPVDDVAVTACEPTQARGVRRMVVPRSWVPRMAAPDPLRHT
jgi:hypothetical protein